MTIGVVHANDAKLLGIGFQGYLGDEIGGLPGIGGLSRSGFGGVGFPWGGYGGGGGYGGDRGYYGGYPRGGYGGFYPRIGYGGRGCFISASKTGSKSEGGWDDFESCSGEFQNSEVSKILSGTFCGDWTV